MITNTLLFADNNTFLLLTFQGYLDHFSRALHLEYSGRGIFIQSLIPFQVRPDINITKISWISNFQYRI